MQNNRKKVMIIGAGFGGLALAKALRKGPFDVLLIDKNNYHTFQPLLYQVATGGLEAGSIAYPVRRIFRGYDNVRFQMAHVQRIEPQNKRVKTDMGDMAYDILIMVTGSTTHYFNFEKIKSSLLTLKSVPEALDIRSYIMQNLEEAIATRDTTEQSELMNVAIIGGGPAGIELAGALAEMRRYVLPKDFPQIDFRRMAISLFEAAPELLANMSDEASAKSLEYLKKLGIQVHLSSKVTDYDGHSVHLEDGTTFRTDTVIWTAGVKGAPIEGVTSDKPAPGNRVAVDAFNQVIGFPDIYALGDVAACITEAHPKGLPMLAPVAIQQAQCLAKNLQRQDQGKTMEPFVYKDKGVMATVGRNKAVVDLPGWKFQGAFAWFVWMLVHILSLVGFRNKLMTFIDWSTNYFTYDRPLGLIIRPFKKPPITP